MSDVLKQVAEALMMACGTFRSHAGEEQRAEECSVALTALRGLEWKPIAEMGKFEHDGVRIGYWIGDQWFVAEYTVYKLDSVPSCYTHFCHPILPTPPKREVGK